MTTYNQMGRHYGKCPRCRTGRDMSDAVNGICSSCVHEEQSLQNRTLREQKNRAETEARTAKFAQSNPPQGLSGHQPSTDYQSPPMPQLQGNPILGIFLWILIGGAIWLFITILPFLIGAALIIGGIALAIWIIKILISAYNETSSN